MRGRWEPSVLSSKSKNKSKKRNRLLNSLDKWKKVQKITHKRFSEVIYLLDGSKIFKINERKKSHGRKHL